MTSIFKKLIINKIIIFIYFFLDEKVLLRQAQQGPKNQAKIMLPPALPNGGIEQKKLDEAPFPSIHTIGHSRLRMARNFGRPARRAHH